MFILLSRESDYDATFWMNPQFRTRLGVAHPSFPVVYLTSYC